MEYLSQVVLEKIEFEKFESLMEIFIETLSNSEKSVLIPVIRT